MMSVEHMLFGVRIGLPFGKLINISNEQRNVTRFLQTHLLSGSYIFWFCDLLRIQYTTNTSYGMHGTESIHILPSWIGSTIALRWIARQTYNVYIVYGIYVSLPYMCPEWMRMVKPICVCNGRTSVMLYGK